MTPNASPADFLERLCADASARREPFKPYARYDRDGDYIEFVFTPASYYEERVDDFLTVYRDDDTRAVIGSVLKGIRRASLQSSGLRVLVESGRVRLSHLLLWGQTNADGRGISTRFYEELLTKTDSADVDAELEVAGVSR
jgi:hypothetical protein